MEKLLTVFTPTYNRVHTLHKCYESLKNQSCKDFKWLIIDDGSTDGTKDVVKRWIHEKNDFEITYIYQSNKGMHGAHNTAYENIDTEINICIDSDDYMPRDAVEKIKKNWNRVKHNKKISGLAGLDSYENGNIIGMKFPDELKEVTLFEINNKYKIPGDKKLVYRSELTKKFPYPIFEGEKYVGLAYKYYKLDEEYRLALINDILCVVEYLEDGSSKNMIKQYKNNPKGFAFYRIENIKNSKATLKFKFKESIHYVASSFISKNKNFLIESPEKILTLLSIPMGMLLYLYIKIKG